MDKSSGPPAVLLDLLAASGPADLAPFLQTSLPLASMTSFSLGFLLLRLLLLLGSSSAANSVGVGPCHASESALHIPCTPLALAAFYTPVTSKAVSSAQVTPLSSRPISITNFWIFLHAGSLRLSNSTLPGQNSPFPPIPMHYPRKPPHCGLCALLVMLLGIASICLAVPPPSGSHPVSLVHGSGSHCQCCLWSCPTHLSPHGHNSVACSVVPL